MIVLSNPPSSADRKPVLPTSLLAIGAVLEGQYEYVIVDGNLETGPLAALDDRLSAAGPDPILAMTLTPGPQLQLAVALCRELKLHHAGLTIVCGGYFPSQYWDVCLRSGIVDYVSRGRGEMVFRQLLYVLSGRSLPLNAEGCEGTGLASIAGLAYRDESGHLISNPLAPVPNPRHLPAWNLDRIEAGDNARPTFFGSRTLGFGLAGFLVSLSRSAWIGFAAGLAVYGAALLPTLFHGEKSLRPSSAQTWLHGLVMVVSVLFFVACGNTTYGRIGRTSNEVEQRPVNDRLLEEQVAFQLVGDHPLLGAGLGKADLASLDVNPFAVWAELGRNDGDIACIVV